MRGQFIHAIQRIKTTTKAWETLVLREARRAEKAYVDNLTDDADGFTINGQQYEVGKNTGYMLAMLIHNQQCSSHVNKMYDSQGSLRRSTQELLRVFHTFYTDLCTSKVQPGGGEIHFLDKCSLPSLSAQDEKSLNASITEEKLLLALKVAPNGKSPGTDGLPSEVYGKYAKQQLPILLKVYNEAFIE